MPTQHVHQHAAEAGGDENLTATLWSRAGAQHPNEVFRYWRDGSWRGLTWAQAGERVRDVAAGLIASGVGPGDRVALFSDTRLEWSLADLAILSAGGVTVAIPAASSREQCRRILAESRAGLVIVGSVAQAGLVADGGAGDHDVFVLDEAGLDVIVDRANGRAHTEVGRRVAATCGGDLATILYTLDDDHLVGQPHTHGDIASAAQRCTTVLRAQLGRSEGTLLALPLDERFGRLGQFVCLEADVPMGFPRSADSPLDDLRSYGPTFLLATPRLLEQLLNTRERAEGARRKIFDFAVPNPEQWADGEQPTPLDSLRRTIVDKLVSREVREALGGQIRFCVVEDDPLPARLTAFLAAAGISIVRVDGHVPSAGATLQR